MKNILLIFCFSVVVVSSFLYLALTKMSIEDLIICTSDENASKMPAPICNYYFSNFTVLADARSLDSRAGLAFAFEIPDTEKRYNVINRLLYIGSDITKASTIDGLTPINAAILLNDSDLVKFLIEKGADLDKPGTENNLNAKEFLSFLKEKDPNKNRDNVQILLDKAEYGAGN